MIRLETVRFAYRSDEPVLEDAAAEIGCGLTLLLGPNGCGKSTLLKLVAGVEHPSRGRIFVGGFDVWKHEVEARRLLAYVPEHPDLSPYATVSEILDLVCDVRGRSRREGCDALEWVGLEGFGGRTVRELSKGQRRRAALAAARIATPPCLLFDEPLEGMDRSFRRTLTEWIVDHRQHGGTIIIVSHDFEAFVPVADRAMTVEDHRIRVAERLPDDLQERLGVLEAFASRVAIPEGRPRL